MPINSHFCVAFDRVSHTRHCTAGSIVYSALNMAVGEARRLSSMQAASVGVLVRSLRPFLDAAKASLHLKLPCLVL